MAEHDMAGSPAIDVGYRFSRSHTFDEQQVKAFALAAGDGNPLHHDAAYAASTRFGGLIVSGTHTASLLMGLTASHFAPRGCVLGMNFSVDLLGPVMATEKVLLEWVVASHSFHLNGGLILELEGALKGSDDRVRVAAHGRVLFTPSKHPQ